MDIKTKLSLNVITEEFERRIKALIEICESPIEEFFFINVFDYFYSQSLLSLRFDFLVRWVDEPTKLESFNYQERGINVYGYIYGIKVDIGEAVYSIIPQFEHKNYRLDFAIFIEKPNQKIKICIECDGHQFHKTKEDNFKDSERTRNLFSDGWDTLRYTGSELFKWNSSDAESFEIMLINNLKNLTI